MKKWEASEMAFIEIPLCDFISTSGDTSFALLETPGDGDSIGWDEGT